MKTATRLVVYTTGLFTFLMSGYAHAETDWVYKSKYGVSFPIIDKWEGSVKSEFRYKDDMSNHYYSYVDVGLTYDWLDWLEVSGNYRYITYESDDVWLRENRPHINAKLKWKLAGFKFSDNNRLEYRSRESKENVWRYRNKIKVEYPLKWSKLEISPYVYEEIFYDFTADERSKNRVEAGLSMKFIKNSKLYVAYQFDSTRSDSGWTDTNCLTTYLKISF